MPKRQLNSVEVRDIVKRFEEGESIASLSITFRVSPSTISRIISGDTHSNVTGRRKMM